MPAGERAVRRVTWNHFLLVSFRRLFGLVLAFFVLSPGEALFAGAVAREIATARSTAVRGRAPAQQDSGPQRRMVILLAPGGQFLAIAARATGIFPRSRMPDTGAPTGFAAPATQGIRSEKRLDMLSQTPPMRHAYISCATFRTGKLHWASSIITNLRVCA
jgi:hypothetical protein